MAHADSGDRNLANLRILVVEDTFIVADEIQFMLESFGCAPLGPVANHRNAMEIIENSELDGALLDINLGEETGYPIAEELAKRQIPFVFMTGYDSSHIIDEFREMPCVQKPFTRDELRRAVEKHFATHHAGRSR